MQEKLREKFQRVHNFVKALPKCKQKKTSYYFHSDPTITSKPNHLTMEGNL